MTVNDLDGLFYFYQEYDDLERCASYKEIIKKIPEIEEIWHSYKMKIAEAKIVFGYRFDKIRESIE